MSELRECALCGAVYRNADRHQGFHDEIDDWVQVIQMNLDERIRRALRRERA